MFLRRSLRRVGELTTRERVKLLEEAARAVEDAADLIEKALRGTPLYDDAKRYLISRLEKLVLWRVLNHGWAENIIRLRR
jgi:hypothetical protein